MSKGVGEVETQFLTYGSADDPFVTAGGDTVAVLTLSATDIRPLLPTEILQAREITSAG